MNIVNEKIYIVLWFWFAFLFIVTSIALVNRVLLVLSPKFRYLKIQKLAPSTDKKYLKRLTSRVGNWFILYQMCIHMKPSHFRDLMDFLVKEHFDKDCNLIIGNKVDQMNLNNKINSANLMTGMMPGVMNNKMMNNKMMMAPSGQMVGMPSAPSQGNTGKKKSKSSSSKNSMYYVRPGKAANFVSVNRDPPSGHSAESDEGAINQGIKF